MKRRILGTEISPIADEVNDEEKKIIRKTKRQMTFLREATVMHELMA